MSCVEGIWRSCRSHCSLSITLLLLAACTATGAAATGQICTSENTLLFGNREVGSRTTADATLTNCGDAPLSFTGFSVDPATGPEFQASTTCAAGLGLTPGAS